MTTKFRCGIKDHYGVETCRRCGRIIALRKHGGFRMHSHPKIRGWCYGSFETPFQQKQEYLSAHPEETK